LLARKSAKQRYEPNPDVLAIMKSFTQMVNECIRTGMKNGVSSLKRLSLLSYAHLKSYDGVPSYYKLCAISKASGILSAQKQSIKRGFQTRDPYVSKPLLVSCYGFKVEDGKLRIPVGGNRHESIPLNAHTLRNLSDSTLRVRSFTLTERSLSLCLSKEVEKMKEITGTMGIDRNLRNLSVGNQEKVTFYDMSKVVLIAEDTRSIVRSFKRNDVRIRKQLFSKYGRRRTNRIRQILHQTSKDIVENAKANKQVIVFEEIRGIRKLYRKGNRQGSSFRGMMNSWPFYEVKRQVEYKAAWEGVPVITLTRGETKGTTMDCPRCGKRFQSAARGDSVHYRQLWCEGCGRWMDRDLAAVLNISLRGWVRFAQSKGEAGEAVRGNPTTPVILRVDASKLAERGERVTTS
jgi:putative transposase